MTTSRPSSVWGMSGGTVAGIVGFWGALAIFILLNAPETRRGGLPPNTFVTVWQSVVWALLTPVIFVAARKFRVGRDEWIGNLFVLIVLGLAIAAIVAGITDIVRDALPMHPRRGGGWSPLGFAAQMSALNAFVVYCGVLAAGIARDGAQRLRDRERQTLELMATQASLEAKLASAQIAAIQLQLQPHFLFNTLNAVSGLLERDPSGARRMLARLSELLRMTLQAGEDSTITLARDLRIVENYLALLESRFPDRLAVSFSVSPETAGVMVPALLLQPLVENAWRHGVEQADGRGTISISTSRRGDDLVVRVSNTGPAVSHQAGGGIGLLATRSRLETMYKGRASFRLFREGPLTVAEVVLPCSGGRA